jgi:hypothetical protein
MNYNQPPYGQQPQQQYNQQYQPQQPVDPFFQLANEMNTIKGWIKFIGIFMIIMGGLYALTIFGIVIAWLPIWMGVLLLNASKHIEAYIQSRAFNELIEYTRKIKSYFIIMGVLCIVGMIGLVVWIVMMIIVLSTVGLQGIQFYRF